MFAGDKQPSFLGSFISYDESVMKPTLQTGYSTRVGSCLTGKHKARLEAFPWANTLAYLAYL
jgi:hypothetical protein